MSLRALVKLIRFGNKPALACYSMDCRVATLLAMTFSEIHSLIVALTQGFIIHELIHNLVDAEARRALSRRKLLERLQELSDHYL